MRGMAARGSRCDDRLQRRRPQRPGGRTHGRVNPLSVTRWTWRGFGVESRDFLANLAPFRRGHRVLAYPRLGSGGHRIHRGHVGLLHPVVRIRGPRNLGGRDRLPGRRPAGCALRVWAPFAGIHYFILSSWAMINEMHGDNMLNMKRLAALAAAVVLALPAVFVADGAAAQTPATAPATTPVAPAATPPADASPPAMAPAPVAAPVAAPAAKAPNTEIVDLSLIHISEPTRQAEISYA